MTAQDEQRLRETLAAAIQPAFDEWLFRMHGVVSSCGHEAEAEGIAAALLPVVLADREKAVQQARAESLEVAALLLRRIVDYWDGRPTEHHGHHIEADLRDVLRAIEADRDHNAEVRP